MPKRRTTFEAVAGSNSLAVTSQSRKPLPSLIVSIGVPCGAKAVLESRQPDGCRGKADAWLMWET